MSADPNIVQTAGVYLPESVKQHVRPWYHRATARLARHVGDAYRFRHDGHEYTLEPTTETAWAFKDAVRDGELAREGVPLDDLTHGGAYDRIIDVGAHHGLYTVLLSKLNPRRPWSASNPSAAIARSAGGCAWRTALTPRFAAKW